MKKLTDVVLFLVCVIVVAVIAEQSSAQEREISKKSVPKAVISAFEKSYPRARVKGYSTEVEEGKTLFEVESYRGSMSLDVSYLSDGTVVEIEEGITSKDLPQTVKETIKSNYPRGRVLKVERKTSGNAVTYEMKIVSGKTRVEMEVDSTGKIVRNPKENNKGDDED